MLRTQVSHLLRQHLDRTGCNQTELAAKVRVSNSTITLYLQEKRSPRAETLNRIATVLGITTDHFFRGQL